MSELMSGVYADEALPDFVVRSEDDSCVLSMTTATFRSLQWQEAFGWVCAALEALPDGSYRVPRVFGDAEVAEDARHALSLVDAEPSAHCILPACGQPSVTVRRDFPLCEVHDAAMQGWDDLLV